MKFPHVHKLKEIASIIDAKYIGDENFPIEGINEIHRVEAGDIVFVDHPKYYDKALESNATIILINKEVDCPEGKALLISDDPFRDFVKIGQHFLAFEASTKQISDSAEIGESTILQPGVFIGNHVKIGKNCVIHSNVSINDHSIIGDNVIIRSGTVLGADAFYYKNRETGFDRLKSVGNVIIEDNVEIGANCTIDRGVSASTIIKEGTIMDNLIQIGHDTIIGRKCLIASQVGIAGCVNVEDEVSIWGQVGITSGATIGSKAVLLAQAGVSKSLEGGKTYFGYPAEEARGLYKKMAITEIMVREYRKK
ncbi:UDP-3-O-[3-hydroxymyristoyl] glucosamine N-acyltransferase [Chishuiella changwenlii]|uniref:UDP-3-O-(3-hydroxymyristoyl)glucosamine N-acyltransferase n=1 Tax=Chishuiella changwenlii TaxID=1434701 RepID=A0A1M7BPY3_9FLAO|nr:UDP-3-O-(3-hydroxymyristoyl)glucosamine N-acyltransferase [Chishuiella changwenlii]GGF03248.1 UDP-3-O-(3-hydroxymyristoyl)glucosamine N-acyltransferase [Chishuiella changwenlii]SHL57125.1 UDP-3-O-[3-hydroxymyristoyl] glucosamine N-acyltransferase [Chishuiella changwenlii]